LGSGVSRLGDPARASRVRSPVCFLDQLSDTLVVDGKKAVGCAQTRRGGAVLIHAAILLGLEVELYGRVFGLDMNEIRAGLAPAVRGADWRQVGDAIAEGLSDALDLEVRRRPLKPLPERFLKPYQTERWAPVMPGG